MLVLQRPVPIPGAHMRLGAGQRTDSHRPGDAQTIGERLHGRNVDLVGTAARVSLRCVRERVDTGVVGAVLFPPLANVRVPGRRLTSVALLATPPRSRIHPGRALSATGR